MSIEAARERVLSRTAQLPSERIELLGALGRVLSEEVRATGDAPPFASSAMDGYAIEAGPAERELELAGESRAGVPAGGPLEPGHAIRISTGATVPEGATAVIRQEDVESRANRIRLRAGTRAGENIRQPGEDMAAGTIVLGPGIRIGAAELGAAAAAGRDRLAVVRPPRVTVLCTGDELREPGTPLSPGQIHNSNGPMLVALARGAGAAIGSWRLLPDERAATIAGLGRALEASDVILIAGGVSVGPHDHVKPALRELEVEEEFWGVALQPGKPTWFGTRRGTLVFGLPGNPVSAYVTFTLFVAPALARLEGLAPQRTLTARLASPVACNRRRTQALRVHLQPGPDGPRVAPNGPQGSHILTSLLGADALAMIPPGEGELAPGTGVELLPLPGRAEAFDG